MNEGYTYKVWFTNSDDWPWRFSVYLDGKLLTNYSFQGYTGVTMSARGAKRAARRYIRRHRKYDGMVFRSGRVE